jgi:TRAP-type C4-dicarboxylate transport system substrate-binding protein
MNGSLRFATALVALMVAGCGGDVDKSGGDPTVTTVELASFEGSGMENDPALARFVQLVHELSNGRLRVDMPSKWYDEGEEREQRVLEDVIAGEATLGWTGTRALDLVGVGTFQPLHAPYLVNSYPAEKAVVADEVTQEMLAGLDDAGLTGLAVLADELRFPVAAERPLLDPSDFENRAFVIYPSRVQADAVTALGARVAEEASARETSWPPYLSNSYQGSMPFVTTNAALWPRTTVLFANPDKFAELSGDDRSAIEQAAAQAAAWSVEHADDRVPREMSMACSQGARIATASARQLLALREAVEPVYVALRSDPEQAALLARVEQLVQDAGTPDPVAVPEGCAYQPGDKGPETRALPEPLDGPGRPGSLPAGSYRYVLTEDEINAAIPPDGQYDIAGANAGVWTWTLENGHWLQEVQLAAQEMPEGFSEGPCEGYYDVHGDQVDFTTVTEVVHGQCAPPTWKAIWQETEDGLAMDVTSDGEDVDFLFGAKTWERID